jgi:hypothetical protein
VQCIGEKRCLPFDLFGNPEGHATSNYASWFKGSASDFLRIPCFRSRRFEPYLVLPIGPLTPLYEENFKSYGKNKIQHTVHLQAAGFMFSTLPVAFVIHYPHAKSESRLVWDLKVRGKERASVPLRKHNEIMYESFLAWCGRTYKRSAEGALRVSVYGGATVTVPREHSTAFCEGTMELPTWSKRRWIRGEVKRLLARNGTNVTDPEVARIMALEDSAHQGGARAMRDFFGVLTPLGTQN